MVVLAQCVTDHKKGDAIAGAEQSQHNGDGFRATLSALQLLTTAQWQRRVLRTFAWGFMFIVSASVVLPVLLQPMPADALLGLRFLEQAGFFVTAVLVYAFGVAWAAALGRSGCLYAVGLLVPFVNLFLLRGLNSRSTYLLRAADFKVGFLGLSSRDLRRLKELATTQTHPNPPMRVPLPGPPSPEKTGNGFLPGATPSKTCPSCGRPLSDAQWRCEHCRARVDNVLFGKLSPQDVKKIKSEELRPITPSSVASFLSPLMERAMRDSVQSDAPTSQAVRSHLFNYVQFQGFCYYCALKLGATFKSGREEALTKQLKHAIQMAASTLIQEKVACQSEAAYPLEKAPLLWNEFEKAWGRFLRGRGEETRSQMEMAKALGLAVFENDHSLLAGLTLHMQLISISGNLSGIFQQIFITEEDDFDWEVMATGILEGD